MNRRERILLIESPCDKIDNDKIDPPLGLLYIAAYLKKRNYDVDIIDLSSTAPEQWDRLIPSGYTVLGFRTICVSFSTTLEILNIIIKKNENSVTIAGGPHASACPGEVAPFFDYIITGEGEKAFFDFLETKKQNRLNQWPAIYNADPLYPEKIEFPDYSLVDISDYARSLDGNKTLAVLTSRGCGFMCAYCNSSVFGREHLYRPIDEYALSQHLTHLKKTFEIDSFKFIDDNLLGMNAESRALKLNTHLKNLGISFRCYLRVDQVSEKVISSLKECGCKHITFGLESCDDDILKMMRRGYTSLQIIAGVNKAFEMGIRIRICLMIGFPPLESNSTIENTIGVLRQINFHEYFVYPFLPYPGCDVVLYPEKYDIRYITENYSEYLQIGKKRKAGYVFATNNYGPEEIRNWIKKVDSVLSEKAEWFVKKDN